MVKDFPIAVARDQLTSLVREAETGTAIRLTRRGRPVARIISEREYNQLQGQRRVGLYELIQQFRRQSGFTGADLDAATIRSWRDRSPGRPVDIDG